MPVVTVGGAKLVTSFVYDSNMCPSVNKDILAWLAQHTLLPTKDEFFSRSRPHIITKKEI